MERRRFIQNCSYTGIGLAITLQSCASVYYATSTTKDDALVVALSEFSYLKKNKMIARDFVLIKTKNIKYPICLYKIEENEYVASLMMCTHNQCELNTGGGGYSCPCHGSEFSKLGKVLEGPAEHDLTTFKTEIEGENILIHIA